MSDRIVVMRDGRIEQIGGPGEVYDEPATLWVADFVGSQQPPHRHRQLASGASCGSTQTSRAIDGGWGAAGTCGRRTGGGGRPAGGASRSRPAIRQAAAQPNRGAGHGRGDPQHRRAGEDRGAHPRRASSSSPAARASALDPGDPSRVSRSRRLSSMRSANVRVYQPEARRARGRRARARCRGVAALGPSADAAARYRWSASRADRAAAAAGLARRCSSSRRWSSRSSTRSPTRPSAALSSAFTLTNFQQALSGFYLHIFLHTLVFAAIGTLEALIVGMPLAYVLGRKAGRFKVLLVVAVLVPFWTSFLLRTLSWETLLAAGGPIQGILNFLRCTRLAELDRHQQGGRHRPGLRLPAVHGDPAVRRLRPDPGGR